MNNSKFDSMRCLKAFRITTEILAVMLIFTVLQWGIASDWGRITIKRVSITGEGGAIQSGIMFIPKGVSAQNPAPAVLNMHGRNNSSNNMINWAIEEARRGYIVLNTDLAGTLGTEAAEDATTENLAVGPLEYLESQQMVKEVTVTGHSMANLSLQIIENKEAQFKPKLKAIVRAGGAFFYSITKNHFPKETNYCIIEATADLYEDYVLGGVNKARDLVADLSGQGSALKNDTVYGDFANGTAFEFIQSKTTHQGMLYSASVIIPLLDFIGQASTAPNPIDNANMVFPLFLLCSAVAFLLFLFFIPSLAYSLTTLPVICDIVNIPLMPSEGKSGKEWSKHLITDLLVPLALFVPVTMWAKNFPTSFFGSLWVNQIFLWLLATSLFGLVMLCIRMGKKKQSGRLTAADFGFGAENEKMLDWKRIFTALSVAVSVAVLCYLLISLVLGTTGLTYQFFSMPGQIGGMTPERFIQTLRYLLMMVPVYFVINVNTATIRRPKTTGNMTVDTTKSVLINMLLSAGVLTSLLIIQFVGIRIIGTGATPLSQKYWDSVSFGWTFPFMMSLASGTAAFMHKKTGNIWVGMFTGWIMAVAITVMQCCIVPAANVR